MSVSPRIDVHNPFDPTSECRTDCYFEIAAQDPSPLFPGGRRLVRLVVEDQYASGWSARETREVARRLLLMAEELDELP